jgi:hypothetical protein
MKLDHFFKNDPPSKKEKCRESVISSEITIVIVPEQSGDQFTKPLPGVRRCLLLQHSKFLTGRRNQKEPPIIMISATGGINDKTLYRTTTMVFCTLFLKQ